MTLSADDITVVIPFYGDPQGTHPLISALISDGFPAERIIVADDASPTPFPADPRGVRVIRRRENGGFGSAVNTGAAEVRTSHMLVLNSDLELPKGFIDRFAAASSPWMPAVAGPRTVDDSGAEVYSVRRFQRPRHHIVEWLTPLARFRHTHTWHRAVGDDVSVVGAATRPVDWVVGACMLIPIAEFRAIGGFDESFHMNSEEVDLQRRLRMIGVPAVRIGSETIMHEGGGSSDAEKRRLWVTRSRVRYCRKWGGERFLVAGLTAASSVNAAFNTLRRLRGSAVDPRATLRSDLQTIRESRR